MQEENHQALIIEEYGKDLKLKTVPRPKPEAGELLIKVDASTINPSDVIFLSGGYFRRELPAVAGLEGTGYVVSANGEDVQSWVGKRVSFFSNYGTWCEYSTSHPATTFEISEDVDIQSAASGLVNPLTAIGFVETFKAKHKGGIIHSAAASSLGQMLTRLCKTEGIPLLGLVRRQESADVLLKQGISDTVVTTGDWEVQLKEIATKKGYDCFFDALGGGETLEKILNNISPSSTVYIYGGLEAKPFTLHNIFLFFSGLHVTGFISNPWWLSTTPEVQQRVRNDYSKHLKNELSSSTGLKVSLSEIEKGIEFSQKNPAGGKVLVSING